MYKMKKRNGKKFRMGVGRRDKIEKGRHTPGTSKMTFFVVTVILRSKSQYGWQKSNNSRNSSQFFYILWLEDLPDHKVMLLLTFTTPHCLKKSARSSRVTLSFNPCT